MERRAPTFLLYRSLSLSPSLPLSLSPAGTRGVQSQKEEEEEAFQKPEGGGEREEDRRRRRRCWGSVEFKAPPLRSSSL